jgi:SAM-dependent methyltransferase
VGLLPVPRRRDDPELMDAPGLPEDEVEQAYRVLSRVNRQFFGGRPILRRELGRVMAEDRLVPGAEVALLDLGSGSGDLALFAARWLRRRGLRPSPIALDRDSTALRLARRSGLLALRADALHIPLPDRSVDLTLAVKFAHHLRGPSLTRLMTEMARVSRRRVLVLDLRRSWVAYWGFVAWSRLFTRSRLVRHDGPLSVLRGFTPGELSELARAVEPSAPHISWSIRCYHGFQLALAGKISSVASN